MLGFRPEFPQTGLCSTNYEQQLIPHQVGDEELVNSQHKESRAEYKTVRHVYSRIQSQML